MLLNVIDQIGATLAAGGGPPGLLDGAAGVALFHAYHYRLTGADEQLDRLHAAIRRSVAALADPHTPRSHCSGLAGIAWALDHLCAEGFIEPAPLGEVDRVLFAEIARDASAGRHDVLHDGVGAMLYALARLPDPGARACLDDAIARLDAAPAPATFDLGLAHGAPAIAVLLARCHEHGIGGARTTALLGRLVDRIRATRGLAAGDALFPRRVDAANRPLDAGASRLGWCYGDLAVATMLAQVGVRTGDAALVAEANEIFAHAARRDAASGAIRDAPLCHGAMGLSHLFRRAARTTGERAHLAAADAWLATTLELGARPGGFAFATLSGPIACDDLLQGLAGIGLALIAAVDDEASGWDRALLVS